jgi:hypothetical protein
MWSWCTCCLPSAHKTQPFVCVSVCPHTPQSSKSKKARKKIYLLLLSHVVVVVILVASLGRAPSPSATPSFVLPLCGKSHFSLFWKRTGSRKEKNKALNLVFKFSFPSLNLVFLSPHWIWERERETHTHPPHIHVCFGPILWCRHIGNCPHEDLATFGYGQDMKVENFKIFLIILATC